MKPLPHEWKTLIPFDPAEALRVKPAALRADVHENTIRNWCEVHGIGRKIGGVVRVSKVALAMHLDGNDEALAAYLAGERRAEPVAAYFRRERLQIPH